MIFSMSTIGLVGHAETIHYLVAVNDETLRAPAPLGTANIDQFDGGLPCLIGGVRFLEDERLNITGNAITIDVNIHCIDVDGELLEENNLATMGDNQYSLKLVTDGMESQMVFSLTGASLTWDIPSDSNFFTAWQRITATYDGVTMKLFWNNEPVASKPAAVTIQSSGSPLYVNRSAASELSFVRLNFLHLLNEAKEPDEINIYTDPSCVLWLEPDYLYIVEGEEVDPGTEVDTAGLEDAIAQAQGKDSSLYTQTSYLQLLSALSDANAVLRDPGKTQPQVNAAESALREAISELVPLGDATALLALITTAKGKSSADYTLSSFENLASIIPAAELAAADPNRTADTLLPYQTALQNALDGLVPLGDNTTLLALIATARGLDNSLYTAITYNALMAALPAAEIAAIDLDRTTASVNQQVVQLQGLLANLVRRADTADLRSMIAEAQGKNADLYTPASYQLLQLALENALAVVDDPNLVEKTLAPIALALRQAIDGLIVKTDRSELDSAIALAESITKASDYTQNSYQALQTALSAAKALGENATQQEVTSALLQLTSALENLVSIVGLKAAIAAAQIKLMPVTDYTAASHNALTQAISVGQAVLGNAAATQSEVENATTLLQSTTAGLVSLTELRAAVAAAKTISPDPYSVASYRALTLAITAAEAVLAKADATQAEVDAAVQQLSLANNALVSVVSLKAAIAAAQAITNGEDYTADSYAAMLTARQNASTMILAEDSTQASLEQAENTLRQAIDGLVSITGLKASLAQAELIVDAALYTTDSFATFDAARNTARLIIAKPNASKQEVEDAKDALDAAMRGLVLVGQEGDVTVPLSALVNEEFTVSALLPKHFTAVKLVNENGLSLGIGSVEKTPSGNQIRWSLTLAMGTAGMQREVKILGRLDGQYVDTGLSFKIDIVVPTNPTQGVAKIRSASFDISSARVNTPVGFLVRTDLNAHKILVFNESSKKMGIAVVAKTVAGSSIIWECELSVGTAGSRVFALCAENINGYADLNNPVLASLTITK